LYIDDLDRCPSSLVVQVLQAVHLLLAFDLFVVVVGVDSRWLLRSLEEEYAQLKPRAQSDAAAVIAGSSTPQDYLEKIFQIPYWVPEMDERGYKRLVHDLVAEQLPRGAQAAANLSAPRSGDVGALTPAPVPAAVTSAGTTWD